MEHDFEDPFYQKYVPTNLRTKCAAQGKVGYQTKTQARNARRYLEPKYGHYFKIYVCDHCHEYHLTTVDDKRKKNEN